MKNPSLMIQKSIKERKSESLHEKTKKIIITEERNEDFLIRQLKESQMREKKLLKVYIFIHFFILFIFIY